tara:strand:+ start:88 stop:996 length:909 start_codon:yes stop_codon:yes gene_type:complete
MNEYLKSQSIAITGANSYIGLNFIKFCINKKIKIKAFCRNPNSFSEDLKKNPYFESFTYALNSTSGLELKNVDSIIHLAHERVNSPRIHLNTDPNLEGAKYLIEQCKINGIKNIIFLSSHLAYKETLSQYGKSKFACEKIFIDNGHTVVRSGIVFGGTALGFYKTLLLNLKSKKFFPIICANAPIYPIHIKDLMNNLIELTKTKHKIKQLYCLGQTHSVKLVFFLTCLASKYCNKKIVFFSLPGKMIYLLMYIASYFSGFFNKIFERVSGALSLINLSTEESIDEKDSNKLKETKDFLNLGL